MTAPLISEIYTGTGLHQNRMAVLHASKAAGPGDLANLTAYLTERGVEAVPGFEGTPVLRVGNFKNDADLKTILGKDFQDWQVKNGIYPVSLFDSKSDFQKLDLSEQKNNIFHLKRFMQNNASAACGVIAMISGASFTLSRLLETKPGTEFSVDRARTFSFTPDKALRVVAGGCFFTAASVLTALSVRNSKHENILLTLEKLEPALMGDSGLKFSQQDKSAVAKHVQDLMRKPWQLTGPLNLAGNFILFCSTRDKIGPFKIRDQKETKKPVELVASALGLTSNFLTMAVPKSSDSVFPGMGEYLERNYHKLTEDFKTKNPDVVAIDRSSSAKLRQGFSKYQMMLAGALSLVGNLSHGLTIIDPERTGYEKIFGPIMAINAVLADVTTSMAKTTDGLNADAIISGTAEFLNKRFPANASREEIMAVVNKTAKVLTNVQEVHVTEDEIAKGVSTLLNVLHNRDVPSDHTIEQAYSKLYAISPFVPTRTVDTSKSLPDALKDNLAEPRTTRSHARAATERKEGFTSAINHERQIAQESNLAGHSL